MPWVKQAVKSDVDFALLCKTLQARTEVLGEIPEVLDFIDVLPEYDNELYTHKKMKTNPETAKVALEAALPVLEELEDYSYDAIHAALFELIAKMEVKNGFMLWPIRVALTGKSFTPGGGVEMAAILGKEETLRRVKLALEKLA